jgi:hypothetical protein
MSAGEVRLKTPQARGDFARPCRSEPTAIRTNVRGASYEKMPGPLVAAAADTGVAFPVWVLTLAQSGGNDRVNSSTRRVPPSRSGASRLTPAADADLDAARPKRHVPVAGRAPVQRKLGPAWTERGRFTFARTRVLPHACRLWPVRRQSTFLGLVHGGGGMRLQAGYLSPRGSLSVSPASCVDDAWQVGLLIAGSGGGTEAECR